MWRANGEVEKGADVFNLGVEESVLSGSDIWAEGPADKLCEAVSRECAKQREWQGQSP